MVVSHTILLIMKKNIPLIIIQFMIFIILYAVSVTVFSNKYLYKWTADHKYLYIWIIILILTIYRQHIIALLLTCGNVIGVLIGQSLGDYIRNENMKKITEIMTAEQVYHLQKHYGFVIWILTLFAFLVIGTIIQKIIIQKLNKN